MACGDKFAHLVRTSKGHTAQTPCGVTGICTGLDVLAWGEAAEHLRATVTAAWQRLIYYQTGPGELDVPAVFPSSAILSSYNAFRKAVDEIPGFWTLLGAIGTQNEAEMVNGIVGTMRDGVCVLEKIQNAIAGLGGEQLAIGEKPGDSAGVGPRISGFLDSFGSLLFVGALVAGAWWVTTRKAEPRGIQG